MRPDPGVLVSRILRGWCAASAALALLAGAGGLATGWGRPAAAFCFLLCGGALMARRNPPASSRLRAAADSAAGLAAVVAVVALVGRDMAPLTALCFLMLAAALLSLDRERVFRMGQRLTMTSGFLAFVHVPAYGYGARALPSSTSAGSGISSGPSGRSAASRR